MARHRIDDQVIRIMEGNLQTLREKLKDNPLAELPTSRPCAYVVLQIDVPRRTIMKWLSEAAGARAREEYKAFAEIYEQYVMLWRNRVEKNVMRIADDVSNRSCLPASLKVLEWLAEDETILGERDDSIGPVPADLASYLTDEEIEALEQREALKQAEEDEDARLLTTLRARKAQEQVERAQK